jgi:putative MFS transporter
MEPSRSSAGTLLQLKADIAARVDRLPITRMQWTWLIAIQLVWGITVGAVDGMPARIYPYIWLPAHQISPHEFTYLVAFDFGVGLFVGEYVGGYIGDRIGRRRTLLLAPVICAVFIIPTPFTHNFWILIVLYTLSNVGVGIVLAVNVALASELVGPGQRGRLLFASQAVAVISAGTVATIPAAYMVPQYYHAYVYLMAGICIVLAIPLIYFLVPESPRWLVEHGEHDLAQRTLLDIERQCIRLTGRELAVPPTAAYLDSFAQAEAAPKFDPRELFRGAYRRNTILLLVTWFVGYTGIVFGYGSYSLTFFALHGMSAHVNFWRGFVASVAGGGTALLLAGFLNERVERKYVVGAAGVVFAIAFMLVKVWPGNVPVIFILSIIFTGAASLWLFAMYNYNSASYPTRIRAVATGWTDGVGHLGGIIGLIPVGYLFAATAPGYLIWFLYVTVIGGAVPALALAWLGTRQRGEVLERMTESSSTAS